MKVEKAETKFTPVVITLESQDEVDALADIVALVANNSEDAVHGSRGWACKEIYSNLHEKLEDYSSDNVDLVFLGDMTGYFFTFR